MWVFASTCCGDWLSVVPAIAGLLTLGLLLLGLPLGLLEAVSRAGEFVVLCDELSLFASALTFVSTGLLVCVWFSDCCCDWSRGVCASLFA